MQKVGAKLRDARVARGMSVQDIVQVTKIPRASVEAIEAGDVSLLPAPVFVRGFIRSYARSVGLDPASLVRDLDRHSQYALGAGEGGADGQRQRTPTETELLPIRPVAAAGGFGSTLKGGYVLLLVLAAGMLVAAWLMVGNQRAPQTNQTASPKRPVIQERVDGVSSFTDVESGDRLR